VKTRGKQAEIARRTGKSRALITRKAKQGKLVEVNGEIDVEASVEALNAEDERRHKAVEPGSVDVAALEKRILEDVNKSTETYAEAQRRKEVALADLRELELAQKSGDVIAVSYAAGYLAEASKAVTNQLLALPDKLAPLLAASTDIRECRDLVLREIRDLLTNLPEKFPLPQIV
jgi:hypothetical protein